MNEQQVRKIVSDMLSDAATSSQYNLTPNTPHIHNGIDSQRIPLSSISNGVIAGMGVMSGGKLDITDPRIGPNSIGIGIVGNLSNQTVPSVNLLSSGYLSSTTFRFFEGSFSQTWTIFYIIITNP